MAGRITKRHQVLRVRVGQPPQPRPDRLLVEEPLEIRIGGTPFTVTMRTPGHDVELAAGLLVAEGALGEVDDLRGAIHCASDHEPNTYNTLNLTLAPAAAAAALARRRAAPTTSACGTCGSDSIDQVFTTSRYPLKPEPLVSCDRLVELPDLLRDQQQLFGQTGASHAAGLFDCTTGELLVVREDVGRHNAVDKVIGWAFKRGLLPLSNCVLQVSGRAGFELAQKAVMAGIPIMSAVSAPTSLAVELAERTGLTLAGFVRGDSLNIYANPARIAPTAID